MDREDAPRELAAVADRIEVLGELTDKLAELAEITNRALPFLQSAEREATERREELQKLTEAMGRIDELAAMAEANDEPSTFEEIKEALGVLMVRERIDRMDAFDLVVAIRETLPYHDQKTFDFDYAKRFLGVVTAVGSTAVAETVGLPTPEHPPLTSESLLETLDTGRSDKVPRDDDVSVGWTRDEDGEFYISG